jgi:hypothetical protein
LNQDRAMTLRLADGVHATKVGDDLVLLDVAADTYFCLPLPEDVVEVDGGLITAGPPALGEALCAAGLAVVGRGEDRAGRPDKPTPPTRTARALIAQAGDNLDLRSGPRHWRALAIAAWRAVSGRRRTFEATLPRHRPTSIRTGFTAGLLADVAVYRRLIPWVPLDGLCLFRSGMMLAYLQALGHRVDWVFGVRTWPFRAHCWLQAGDVALDDEAERLAAYAPIMVA